jgi:Mg-chelatase subunit ChlD
MSNNKDRRSFENILREPLTRHRLMLNSKLRAAQNPENEQPFTLEDLKKFMAGIRNATPEFQSETLNVLEAVQTGKAPQEPKFDTPETQLIWGAALAFLTLNPEQKTTWPAPEGATPLTAETPLAATGLWKQVTGTRTAYEELLSHAHHVREALRDKDTKYSWGDPGTGFTFNRQKNLINIDLMQSMIVGFEHARADVYREIGHSLLSTTYPKRMRELYRDMQPLLKKSRLAQMKKGPQLKPDEYKQLRMLSAEWQLRHMMFAAAEENVANRFVANIGQQVLQDYGVSLNNTAVTHRGVGLTRVPQKGVSDELKRYMNLCNAVQLSFFQNNNLFDNTDAGWNNVGVDPSLVRKTSTLAGRPDDQKDDADGIEHPDFKHLRELCGGPQGLENLQPKQHERLFGWANLASRVARADEDRKAIIEQIWREYGEDLLQRILEETNDQVDQQLKEAQEKQQQQDQDGQDGDDGQEGDDGQDQDGQDGQDGQEGGQPGKGKPKKGQKPQKKDKKKQDRGKPQGEQDDADDDADGEDADGQDGQKSNKKDKNQKKDKGQKGEKGDEQDGEPGEGDEQDGEDADGQGKEGQIGADDEDTVPVEGAGDMPAPDTPTEVPSDELEPGDGQGQDGEGQDADGEDADGQDADGEDADGDDGMTAEELEKELEKKEQEGQDGEDADGEDADGQDADGDGEGQGKPGKGKPKKGKPSKQAGHGKGKSLGDLAKEDWTDYNRRIAELASPITAVRKLFKSVQDKQMQRKRTMGQSLEILPENGEIKDRFNTEAHRNLIIKKRTGQVEEHDLKRFQKDEVSMVPTEIDIVIMIDGSGSMSGVPMNSALQAAAIMFEAASGKDMKMNVYVGLWGDDNPPIIIYPGADRIEIGKQMQRARNGLNSGTDFAPAVKKVAETIGNQRGKSGTLSGFTHVLIISDGDIFDAEKSKEKIQTMFTYSDKVTFDAAVISRPGTSMEQMAKSIKGHKPFQDVGVAVGNDPNKVPMEIVGLLLEKVRKTGSFVAIPNSQKRRAMKKAHNKMDRKP